MLFDTHCHLNFKPFIDREEVTLTAAKKSGVELFVVPGTDIVSSQKAVKTAQKYAGVYAAVGIHPHHIYEYHSIRNPGGLVEYYNSLEKDMAKIENLLANSKVVAIGEVGIDRYYYRDTKYSKYIVDETFIELQAKALAEQIKLALKYDKALILHNRQAVDDILVVLSTHWDERLAGRTVFHCCEASERLLEFARKHEIYLGVDGDITWSKKKQRFIKEVPLGMLVLETDSPYLTPEPAKAKQKFPNEPANLTYVRDLLAKIKEISAQEVEEQTTKNALRLFRNSGMS